MDSILKGQNSKKMEIQWEKFKSLSTVSKDYTHKFFMALNHNGPPLLTL